MKVIFFGSPNYTDPVKSCLKNNFELIQVIEKPRDWNSDEISRLISLNADFFVVANFGQILPSILLEIPKFGSINIHPSLLPQYRGPSPVQTAILKGDEKTGVTIIKMDEKMDHGPILKQTEEQIFPDDTYESLVTRLFEKSAELLKDVITDFNNIQLISQDDTLSSGTKLITRDDGFINLSNENSLKIENLKLKIRAYYPWPGVWTKYDLSDKEAVIKLLPNDQIQVEGKKPMSFKDFKNGYEKGSELLKKLGFKE